MIIDPTANAVMQTSSWASYSSDGFSAGTSYGQMVGNYYDYGANYNRYWRSISSFDLSPIKAANGRVVGAHVDMSPITTNWPASSTTIGIGADWGSSWAYGGAYPGLSFQFPGGPLRQLITDGDGPGGQACYGSGCQYLNGSNLGRIFVGELVDYMVAPNGANTNWVNISLYGGESPGWYYFRESQVSLWVDWDRPTPKTALIAPENEATLATSTTPQLSATAVVDGDTNDNPPNYMFVIGQSDTPIIENYRGTCQLPATQTASSGWQSGTSWTVPHGVLRDGTSYWWGVITAGTYGSLTSCSPVRKFRVDQRLGASGTSPTESVGPATVNLATGNVVVSAGSKTISTLGGGIGVGFTYNSKAPAPSGLNGYYWWDANQSASIDSGDQMYLQRVDDAIDFNYGKGGTTPGSNTVDWFINQWTGYITAQNSGDYYFGGINDDFMDIRVGGTLVYSSNINQGWPTSPVYGGNTVHFDAGETKKIDVNYRENTGDAYASVYTKVSGDGDQKLHQAFALSTEPRPLSTGWRMSIGATAGYSAATVGEKSIVLTADDGSTEEFIQSAVTPTIYKPPLGGSDLITRMSSGALQLVTGDGSVYEFDSTGRLLSVSSSTDDRQPAATTYQWSTSAGGVAQLVGMTDPVSGRQVTLTYGPTGCPTMTGFDDPAPAGKLCKVAFWDGTATELFYNAGRLARIRQPGDATAGYPTTDFGYDANGLLNRVRDALANDAITAGVRTDDDTARTLITYTAGKATQVQLPQPNAAASPVRPSTTISYGAQPSASTLGDTSTSVAGLSEPNGYARRVTFDAMFRGVDSYATNGVRSTISWDGASERVSYTDTAVGTPEAMRASTIYDQNTKFNSAGRPVETWGPAPVGMFSGAVPATGQAGNVPHTTTTYDGGIYSLAAAYWSDPDFSGAPKIHTTGVGSTTPNAIDRTWGHADPVDGTATGWGLQLDGWIDLAQTGPYTFTTNADGRVLLSVDGQAVISNLDQADPNATAAYGGTWNNPTVGRHRISLRFRQTNGNAMLQLFLTNPSGGAAYLPTTQLSPDYGLVTSTTGVDGVVTTTDYASPHLGLASKVTRDPSGLKLIDSYGYETEGVAGKFLRRTTHTLPGGYDAAGAVVNQPGGTGQAATVTYDHYTATEAAPTGTGCAVGGPQAGLPKRTTAADPDGNGPQTAIVREVAYDNSARPVASRVVGDAAWSCVTYDARGRVTAQSSPSFTHPTDSSLNTPARTVSTTYSVGGNPFVTETYDTNTTNNSRQKTGVTIDLLGRVVSYRDEWGFSTDTVYDQAGRPTTVTVKKPGGTTVETLGYTYKGSGGGVNQLATQTLDAVTQATVAYDSLGRQSSVTYGNGTTKTAPTYDSFQRPTLTEYKTGSTTITTETLAYDNLTGRVKDQSVDGVDAYSSGENFAYDNAGRLTSWRGRDPSSANTYWGTPTYTGYTAAPGCATGQTPQVWGRNSNRLEQRLRTYNPVGGLTADVTDTSCFDNADRLTAFNPASGANPWSTPVYDSHGNLTSSGSEVRGYDSANRHLVTKASTGTGGSAPTVVATSKVQAPANSGSLAVPKPAGLAVGDLVVVFVTLHPWYGISGPSGFTQVQYLENWNTDPLMQGEFWSKTATAADVSGTGWAFTVSGPPDTTTTAAAVAIRGAATAGTSTPPFADGNFDNTGGGGWSNANSDDNAALSLPTPQVTTSTANDLRVTLTASNIDGVTFTPPVGFTENLDTSYATGRNIEIATKAQATTGPSGQPTVTASAPTGLSGYHLTIRPAPPSGSATTVAYTRDAADRIIERNLNGVSINRYAYTGAADSPSVVLNAANAVVERSVSLPGGVLLTTRGSNASDVWSYPNAHGDIVATCNGNGVKQGPTRAYDPFGNPLGTTTLPDNSAGNIDYTWHGTQTRPLEHEPNLTPTIEMGARQYTPQLGRFIETDPIEGGTPNDYTYPTDPINSSDLNGLCGWWGNPFTPCVHQDLKNAIARDKSRMKKAHKKLTRKQQRSAPVRELLSAYNAQFANTTACLSTEESNAEQCVASLLSGTTALAGFAATGSSNMGGVIFNPALSATLSVLADVFGCSASSLNTAAGALDSGGQGFVVQTNSKGTCPVWVKTGRR